MLQLFGMFALKKIQNSDLLMQDSTDVRATDSRLGDPEFETSRGLFFEHHAVACRNKRIRMNSSYQENMKWLNENHKMAFRHMCVLYVAVS